MRRAQRRKGQCPARQRPTWPCSVRARRTSSIRAALLRIIINDLADCATLTLNKFIKFRVCKACTSFQVRDIVSEKLIELATRRENAKHHFPVALAKENNKTPHASGKEKETLPSEDDIKRQFSEFNQRCLYRLANVIPQILELSLSCKSIELP